LRVAFLQGDSYWRLLQQKSRKTGLKLPTDYGQLGCDDGQRETELCTNFCLENLVVSCKSEVLDGGTRRELEYMPGHQFAYMTLTRRMCVCVCVRARYIEGEISWVSKRRMYSHKEGRRNACGLSYFTHRWEFALMWFGYSRNMRLWSRDTDFVELREEGRELQASDMFLLPSIHKLPLQILYFLFLSSSS
jgi:hypothetical protein